MSERAREYVQDLPPEAVTSTERYLLTVVAEEYSDRFGSANLPLEDLCQETKLSRRHLRRLLAGLQGVLDYIPGRGVGHFGQFRFPGVPALPKVVEKPVEALSMSRQKGDGKGTDRGQKGDAQGPPIRKDLNLDQDQNLNPPNPLFSKGGTLYRLTPRHHARLSRYWEKDRNQPRDVGSGYTWRNLLRQACGDLAIALADAEHDLLLMDEDLWSSRLELRKAPQSA